MLLQFGASMHAFHCAAVRLRVALSRNLAASLKFLCAQPNEKLSPIRKFMPWLFALLARLRAASFLQGHTRDFAFYSLIFCPFQASLFFPIRQSAHFPRIKNGGRVFLPAAIVIQQNGPLQDALALRGPRRFPFYSGSVTPMSGEPLSPMVTCGSWPSHFSMV